MRWPDLAGHVAIVTGASSGIGRATAEALAHAGVSVVVNHRPAADSARKGDAVCESIRASGGRAMAVAADVSQEEQVEALFSETLGRFGRLDLLVNNAGIESPAAIQDMTLADWQRVIDVNLTGPFLCARAAARVFLERGAQGEAEGAIGNIIFVTSVHQAIPWAFQANYAASKGGAAMLMRSLAQELAPSKIRVNAVAPGAIRTAINRDAWQTEAKLARLIELIPYGRIGEPQDVAHAVVWLASAHSDYVTGTTLFIDGGMTLYPAFRGAGLKEATVSKPIEDYAIIGNMVSAALVGRDGSIDWLCLPRFDQAACFAALLGDADNGRWLLAPQGPHRITRRYIADTAVLETRFEMADGAAATLTDFMPLTDDEEKVDVVRVVRGERGEVAMEMELVLRFNYGQAIPWVRRRDYGLSAVAGADAVELHTPVAIEGRDMRSIARFTVRGGDNVPFTLSYHRSHKAPHFVPDRGETLDRTISWWREWARRCRFDAGRAAWREAVVRSLITLKLLTFRPTGGIVAAVTTSLPETLGGNRNWDYRYCWLRDSALTLYALLNAGYRDEAEAWRQWLLRASAGHPEQLQIMYGLAGERWLPENEVPWLAGYEGSRPVRVGNAAAAQMQLDVYGEVIETLHAGREAALAPRSEAWRLETALLNHLERIWRVPDHGIWEMRGAPRIFTHSRLMCWVAFDRALKSCEHFGLGGPVDRWQQSRDAIHADICANGFDSRCGSFVQYFGGSTIDASLLLIPQTGFLPADDPRMQGTVAAVERHLVHDGLALRYDSDISDDGIGSREGAFLACSFWLADAYALMERTDAAIDLFERLLALRNDVGLLAEEYDLGRGRLAGNFPQAFSHVGLINTACNLVNRRGPARQRAERVAPSDAA